MYQVCCVIQNCAKMYDYKRAEVTECMQTVRYADLSDHHLVSDSLIYG